MKVIWSCPRCGTTQDRDTIETTEITEPGVGSRVEYFGKIRPTYIDDREKGSYLEYECLVCGNVYDDFDYEEPNQSLWLVRTPSFPSYLHTECNREDC